MPRNNYSRGGDAVYGLGLIGAIVYYIRQATNFGMIVFGLLKAIVWPALIVYHLLGLFKI